MFLGDTIGSVESLISVLKSLDSSMASLSIAVSGVGDVTEGDLKIAQSINGNTLLPIAIVELCIIVTGIVLGFGIAGSKGVKKIAEKYKVTLLSNDVIYHLLEQLKVHN